MKLDQFKDGYAIIEELEDNGFEAYFVGGCIRNYLLGLPVNDIDITTSAKPDEIIRLFPKTIPLNVEHGTVIVRYNHLSYEVTTFKTSELQSNEPLSLYEDLKRRDFTLNAIAMNKEGHLLDYFKGQEAIKQRKLIGVENTSKRIVEDPLRIIRAFRLMGQYNFSLDRTLERSIQDHKDLLNTVAVERITDEFNKLLQAPHLVKCLAIMNEYNIFNNLPYFKTSSFNAAFCKEVTRRYDSFSEFIAHYALLNDLPIRQVMKEWKASNKMIDDAVKLYTYVQSFKKEGLSSLNVYQVDKNLIATTISLSKRIHLPIEEESFYELKETLPIQSKDDIDFSGNDLISLFPHKKRGKWIGDTLGAIEIAILNEDIKNNKMLIKEWVLCHQQEMK
ncbi:MAG TPA: CCA tRNA nucleotidyltransferase [Pseudogracilibacillus sp.]|nr:CCA tRNA nucleotidyltransferase [Pseudogracilibacillus sp.]